MDSVEDYIKVNLFSATGEGFLDLSFQGDPIYLLLHCEGSKLCTDFIPDTSSFYFVDSSRIQAAAIHKYNSVLVYKGMLEFIFRISSMMAGAERRKLIDEEGFYQPWLLSKQNWLGGGEFDWEDQRYWWLHQPEYRDYFDACTIGIFKFLVLHEIGHLHNMHGKRKEQQFANRNKFQSWDSDIHKALDESQSSAECLIARHAREICADTYAFQFLFESIKGSSFTSDELNAAGNHVPCVISYGVSIFYVAAFFWSLSFILKMPEDTQNESYPSHLFRLGSVEAASLEHGICGMGPGDAEFSLKTGMATYLAVFNRISPGQEFNEWRLQSNNPVHLEHYQNICNEVSKWSNTAFGVSDELRNAFIRFYGVRVS